MAAVLLDASGKVLVSGRRPVTVPALSTEFSASGLVVAVNDFPSEAPKPDDPFTFSARRFVVRGDGKLDPSDGLSYAVRIYNPPVDPVSRTVTLRRTIKLKPKGQTPIDVPTLPEEPQKVPEDKEGGALILDLAGVVIESNLGAVPQAERLRAAGHDPRHGHAEEGRPRHAVFGRRPCRSRSGRGPRAEEEGLSPLRREPVMRVPAPSARRASPTALALAGSAACAYSIRTLVEPTPTRLVATSRTVATNRMFPVRDLNSPR